MTELFINAARSPSFRDGVEFAWSASTIKAAKTCLRYYQYSVLEGWHSPNKSVHLRFGGHYATAIEHYYKLIAQGADPEEATRAVVREALEATWDREECPTCAGTGQIAGGSDQGDTWTCVECNGTGKGEGTPWESGHNTKTRANLIRTIVWYLDQFKDDPAKPLTLQSGDPAVELSITFEVDGGNIFAAHLDRLAEFAWDPYVMDEKTTGTTVSQSFFNGFSPDDQMSMYTFLGKAAFGVPVKGVIIDAAQIAVGFTRFERGFTFRTPGQLNEWYDDTMLAIETAQRATREVRLPQNPTACGNYAGCQFRTVCSRDPAARRNFLAGDFVQTPSYDPLEVR